MIIPLPLFVLFLVALYCLRNGLNLQLKDEHERTVQVRALLDLVELAKRCKGDQSQIPAMLAEAAELAKGLPIATEVAAIQASHDFNTAHGALLAAGVV